MSTKIYNGYRIRVSDLPDGGIVCMPAVLRDLLEPIYMTRLGSTVAALATFHVDDTLTGDPGNNRSPILEANMSVAAAHRDIQTTRQRNPAMDFGFDVVFCADPTDPEWVYALTYTEQNVYRKAFETIPGVTYWGYWNNTDQPDDVTDTEWEQRRETWNRVLPNFEAPARVGVTWNLLGDMHATFVTAEEAIDHIPSRMKRANRIAVTQVINDALQTYDGARAVTTATRAVRNNEDRIEQLAREIEPDLVDITIDVLNGVTATADKLT